MKQRQWQLEDLLDGPGQIGRAQADARFNGNTSARRALDNLDRAIRQLGEQATDADEAEAS